MAALEETTRNNADRDKFDCVDAGSDGDYEHKIEVFERWLLDNDAKFPKLTMQKYDAEVRGVHATQNINPEEIIVQIPLNCVITVEMGKATDVGRALLESRLDLDAPKHVFLMLFMLIDRASETSHFKPYYDILPPTLSNMPIFWSEEELALLEGSHLKDQVNDRKAAIQHDYRAICELCPTFADVATLEDFMWARMCVCSRNFGINVNGVRTSAMVPYADMLNHYRPRETKWTYDSNLGAFTITSLQHLESGVQVYDSYGQKCNHRFLLNYGFAIEKNVEPDNFCPNEVPVKFGLDEKDSIIDVKISFWVRDGHSKMIRICAAENDNLIFALACLRVIVATPTEFNDLMATVGLAGRLANTVKDVRFPISLRNERAAMVHLQALLQKYLSEYPRSMEEDSAALAGDTLRPFSNERHATIQVMGEKEVLHHYLTLCETVIRLLDVDVYDDVDFATKFEEVKQNAHGHIVKHCTDDPSSIVGQCRRLERRRLQQAQERVDASSDPMKPHIV